MPSTPDLPTPQGQSLLYSNRELPGPQLIAAVLGLSTQKNVAETVEWLLVGSGLDCLLLYPKFTTSPFPEAPYSSSTKWR